MTLSTGAEYRAPTGQSTRQLMFEVLPLSSPQLPRKELDRLTLNRGNSYRSSMHWLLWCGSCYIRDSSYGVLARLCGKLVGWSALTGYTLDFVRISVYVLPALRRNGIGSRIVMESKKVANELWPNKTLMSEPWDRKGRSFFEKMDIRKRRCKLR